MSKVRRISTQGRRLNLKKAWLFLFLYILLLVKLLSLKKLGCCHSCVGGGYYCWSLELWRLVVMGFSLIWRRDNVDSTNFRVNVGCFNERKRGWSMTSCFVKKKLLTMDMMLSEIITCGYKWHWWWRDEEKRGYQFFFFFFYMFFSKQILFLLYFFFSLPFCLSFLVLAYKFSSLDFLKKKKFSRFYFSYLFFYISLHFFSLKISPNKFFLHPLFLLWDFSIYIPLYFSLFIFSNFFPPSTFLSLFFFL